MGQGWYFYRHPYWDFFILKKVLLNLYQIAINKLDSLKFDPLKEYDEAETIGFGYLEGDGSEINHFIASFTSIKLLKTINYSKNNNLNKTLFHIDATYKITRNHFPLIIIGRSDYNGTFHLVSVSISSHEQEIDFTHIINSLAELCKQLKIEFSPSAFMQDACPASKNAIKSIFPNAELFMCWFHVFVNIKKRDIP